MEPANGLSAIRFGRRTVHMWPSCPSTMPGPRSLARASEAVHKTSFWISAIRHFTDQVCTNRAVGYNELVAVLLCFFFPPWFCTSLMRWWGTTATHRTPNPDASSYLLKNMFKFSLVGFKKEFITTGNVSFLQPSCFLTQNGVNHLFIEGICVCQKASGASSGQIWIKVPGLCRAWYAANASP